jgi:hypothetical protein
VRTHGAKRALQLWRHSTRHACNADPLLHQAHGTILELVKCTTHGRPFPPLPVSRIKEMGFRA